MTPLEPMLAPALAGQPSAVRALVAGFTPVILARASRALVRSGRSAGRDPRQEIADLTQDVLLLLFKDDGRVLRSWEPERGLSLLNFVGLVAEREVGHIARSDKRSPWSEALGAANDAQLDDAPSLASGPESDVGSRDLFDRLHQRLEVELHARGMELYRLLILEDTPIPDVCAATGLSADAAYAWRSRLLKRVRELLIELQSVSMSESAPPKPSPERSPR